MICSFSIQRELTPPGWTNRIIGSQTCFGRGKNGESARLSLSRERNHWRLTIGSNEQVVGPTIGQGWTLLEYPNAIGRRWGSMLNGLWVFVLCVPIGFWARGRVQFGVAALVIALLLLIPAIAGVEPTSFGEWIGAMMGFLGAPRLGGVRNALVRFLRFVRVDDSHELPDASIDSIVAGRP